MLTRNRTFLFSGKMKFGDKVRFNMKGKLTGQEPTGSTRSEQSVKSFDPSTDFCTLYTTFRKTITKQETVEEEFEKLTIRHFQM